MLGWGRVGQEQGAGGVRLPWSDTPPLRQCTERDCAWEEMRVRRQDHLGVTMESAQLSSQRVCQSCWGVATVEMSRKVMSLGLTMN